MLKNLDDKYSDMFKDNHPFRTTKSGVTVNIPFPNNQEYESVFMSSANYYNEVDEDIGEISMLNNSNKYFSDLFERKKLGEELYIFCHDNKIKGEDGWKGRLFEVKMEPSIFDKDNNYFKFNIIRKIQDYYYYPSRNRNY